MTVSSLPALRLDHIAVSAPTLEEALHYTQETLGLSIPEGGKHPKMGTRNHLLSLGPDLFLEVIAIDPEAKKPTHPRWFNLDQLKEGPARLSTWVLNTSDIKTSLSAGPPEGGLATTVTRGDLSWLISVPEDGSMPMAGFYPTLIQWPEGPHPASGMEDFGCRLDKFLIKHPEADRMNKYLMPCFADPRVTIEKASTPVVEAHIETPDGIRKLVG